MVGVMSKHGPMRHRHVPQKGLKVKQLIQIIMVSLVFTWLVYHWQHGPRGSQLTAGGKRRGSAEGGRARVVVEGVGDAWDDEEMLISRGREKKAAEFAEAGTGIVGRIAAKGGFRVSVVGGSEPLKLKDLVDAKVQGGGNLLGERGDAEEEVGKRKWEDGGEGDEDAITVTAVEKALQETSAVEAEGEAGGEIPGGREAHKSEVTGEGDEWEDRKAEGLREGDEWRGSGGGRRSRARGHHRVQGRHGEGKEEGAVRREEVQAQGGKGTGEEDGGHEGSPGHKVQGGFIEGKVDGRVQEQDSPSQVDAGATAGREGEARRHQPKVAPERGEGGGSGNGRGEEGGKKMETRGEKQRAGLTEEEEREASGTDTSAELSAVTGISVSTDRISVSIDRSGKGEVMILGGKFKVPGGRPGEELTEFPALRLALAPLEISGETVRDLLVMEESTGQGPVLRTLAWAGRLWEAPMGAGKMGVGEEDSEEAGVSIATRLVSVGEEGEHLASPGKGSTGEGSTEDGQRVQRSRGESGVREGGTWEGAEGDTAAQRAGVARSESGGAGAGGEEAGREEEEKEHRREQQETNLPGEDTEVKNAGETAEGVAEGGEKGEGVEGEEEERQEPRETPLTAVEAESEETEEVGGADAEREQEGEQQGKETTLPDVDAEVGEGVETGGADTEGEGMEDGEAEGEGQRRVKVEKRQWTSTRRALAQVPGGSSEGATPVTGAWEDRQVADTLELRVSVEAVGPAAVAVTWEIQVEETNRDPWVEFALGLEGPEQAWFGGGERDGGLNRKGERLLMSSMPVSVHGDSRAGKPSPKPVPFVMSSAGYGVWVDSYSEGTFDLQHAEKPTQLVVRYVEKRLRVVFFGGPLLVDVLAQFTALVGRPVVPPLWAFAPWIGRDAQQSSDEVLSEAEELRKANIPASVRVIDRISESGCNGFLLSGERFKDLEGMVHRLQALGFVAVLGMTPCVSGQILDGQDEETAGQYVVRNATGQPQLGVGAGGVGARVDLSSPGGTHWWHRQLNRTAIWGTLRGFRMDDLDGQGVPPEAVFADGSPPGVMRNKYQELYHDSMRAYIGEAGLLLGTTGFGRGARSPLLATRNASSSLSQAVLTAQTAALSGQYLWSPPIGPPAESPRDKEMFIRWTQFRALSPLMYESGGDTGTLWDHDQETQSIFGRFARLHMSLAPYLARAAERAAQEGRPIICPMLVCFQADKTAASMEHQYLLGEDLLVAPVTERRDTIKVYLPQGQRWVQFWTGEVFPGGRAVELAVPREQMPIFVRAGAMLELVPEDTATLLPAGVQLDPAVKGLGRQREIQVWPGSEGVLAASGGLTLTLRRSAPQLLPPAGERADVAGGEETSGAGRRGGGGGAGREEGHEQRPLRQGRGVAGHGKGAGGGGTGEEDGGPGRGEEEPEGVQHGGISADVREHTGRGIGERGGGETRGASGVDGKGAAAGSREEGGDGDGRARREGLDEEEGERTEKVGKRRAKEEEGGGARRGGREEEGARESGDLGYRALNQGGEGERGTGGSSGEGIVGAGMSGEHMGEEGVGSDERVRGGGQGELGDRRAAALGEDRGRAREDPDGATEGGDGGEEAETERGGGKGGEGVAGSGGEEEEEEAVGAQEKTGTVSKDGEGEEVEDLPAVEDDTPAEGTTRRLLQHGDAEVEVISRELVVQSEREQELEIILMFRQVDLIFLRVEGVPDEPIACKESSSFDRKVSSCLLAIKAGRTVLTWTS